MKEVLVLGAGRSATALISYLLGEAPQQGWFVTVGDFSQELAAAQVGRHPFGKAVFFNAEDAGMRRFHIERSDVVVSLLPAQLHLAVAEDCVRYRAHLVTASYVSEEMQALDAAAVGADVLLLNEIGADPGLDHLSAMRNIDDIRARGGRLRAFTSYCGALVAPASNTNPWGYKFTWSPLNVVLAGQGTARYLWGGGVVYVPYGRLFSQPAALPAPGYGTLEGYPNRDSLGYVARYGIPEVQTLVRGTLRVPGFCAGWEVLARLGLTDHSYRISDSGRLTQAEWLARYLPPSTAGLPPRVRIASLLGMPADAPALDLVAWLGLWDPTPIERSNATPAEILLDLLQSRWQFEAHDRDALYLTDTFDYLYQGRVIRRTSTLAVEGDAAQTAIAKTVGLPAAIAVKRILRDEVQLRGVRIPTDPELYEPILAELATLGIAFSESEVVLE